jgi:general secretion pathway protein B
MSYILDALKKAERERGIARTPTLATVHERRNFQWHTPWIVSGAIAILAISAAWIFLHYSKTMPQASTAARVGVMPSASDTGEIINAAKAPASVNETPETKTLTPSADSSSSKSSPPAYEAVTRKSLGGETRTNISKKAAVVFPESIQSSSAIDASLPEELADADDSTEDAPALNRNTTEAKPSSLHEAAARMTLNIHVYSEAKDERLVFIDGKKYREGDYVAGQYLIEEITQEGAVLRNNADRVILRPGRK